MSKHPSNPESNNSSAGDSRVGIALSDPMRIIAKPFKTLTNNSELLSQLRLLID